MCNDKARFESDGELRDVCHGIKTLGSILSMIHVAEEEDKEVKFSPSREMKLGLSGAVEQLAKRGDDILDRR